MRKQGGTDAAWQPSARGVESEKRLVAPADRNVRWKIRLISVKLLDIWIIFGYCKCSNTEGSREV